MTEGTTEGPRPAQFDAPKDAPTKDATGYAVYDRTLGQFVGSVTKGKPSDDDAQALAPRSTVATVRV